MNDPFREEYWTAACIEIDTLEAMDAWKVVDQTDDIHIIDSIWTFKLKQFHDMLIKKSKATFCATGNQQLEGVDFFETCALVV